MESKKIKMKETSLEHMVEENNPGIELITKGKYEEAIEYFRKRMPSKNHLEYYGLATALFKGKTFRLTQKEIEEIIELYSASSILNPEFADSYLMRGMAYEQFASILTGEYKKNPYENSEQKVDEIKKMLFEAKKLIQRSLELNPEFKDTVNSELKAYDRRIEGLDNLKRYYDENQHSFN